MIPARRKGNCRSNENKMSDGHRERALLGVEAKESLKT
jgi:hypothetical protein